MTRAYETIMKPSKYRSMPCAIVVQYRWVLNYRYNPGGAIVLLQSLPMDYWK